MGCLFIFLKVSSEEQVLDFDEVQFIGFFPFGSTKKFDVDHLWAAVWEIVQESDQDARGYAFKFY